MKIFKYIILYISLLNICNANQTNKVTLASDTAALQNIDIIEVVDKIQPTHKTQKMETHANAGGDIIVDVNKTFRLNASESTGEIVGFEWKYKEYILADTPIVNLNIKEKGSYEITLEIVDSSGEVSKDTINVDVVSDEMFKKSDEILLCSVGRFSKPKNFINAVYMCKYLVDYGINLKWYIIGYGSEQNIIEKTIQKLKMEKHFIILGKKLNPYPYMKACDIYIQPSLYEGKAVTVREAQILCKPVIVTNYATSKSQVKNGYDGVIVPLSNNKAAKGIYTFIKDKDIQKRIVTYLEENDFGNEKEVEKIYEL